MLQQVTLSKSCLATTNYNNEPFIIYTMAKDGDIIDVMFGWIVSLFGWLLGLVVKVAIALIGGIFSLIVGLFKKKEPAGETNLEDSIAESETVKD